MQLTETPANSGLPQIQDKELLAMNQLMADKQYRIKLPSNFLHYDRTDRVNPDFVLYTLNDFLGHVQNCVASTKKMLFCDTISDLKARLAVHDPQAGALVSVALSIDVRGLSQILSDLQKNAHEVSVADLVPFVRLLFRSLIRVYYLGAPWVAKKYRAVYSFVAKDISIAEPEGLKSYASSAIGEWLFLYSKVMPGLYPLVLRMCSPVLLSEQQLFYANGSRVLAWLQVLPGEVLIRREDSPETQPEPLPAVADVHAPVPEVSSIPELPSRVKPGLEILERLFPEAGWDRLETMPDFCPYFMSVLEFQDAFGQLAPENPLQQTMTLFVILEKLFQGLRLIKFEPLPALSARDDIEDINRILEDWILYQETVFDKVFSADLKAYTHQIYTQPEYYKTPYGRKLLSNMYSLIKNMFLPWFDIKMYGSVRTSKEDRMAPFFVRVSHLRRVLGRYHDSIRSAPVGSELNPEGSVPGVQNPWAPYKFDIANPVSVRLDTICGGKHSRIRTNALLIEYTLAVLEVLDWWINDKNSYAYLNSPEHLYRVIEPGSAVPAFGVKPRTDVEAIFSRHMKGRIS
jgi:hypothetical protein